MIVTEFGRTVHVNGTFGTDHGTAWVAFWWAARSLQTDHRRWPGLGSAQLYEGRDLTRRSICGAFSRALQGIISAYLRACCRPAFFQGLKRSNRNGIY